MKIAKVERRGPQGKLSLEEVTVIPVSFDAKVLSAVDMSALQNAVCRFLTGDWGLASELQQSENQRLIREQLKGKLFGEYRDGTGKRFQITFDSNDSSSGVLVDLIENRFEH